MRQLPPLPALRAFEAAARHLSFKRAAEELCVTPTAISHQVRQLEEALGLQLFERRTRQVLMTVEAQLLYPVLRDGFDAFARVLDGLNQQRGRAAVTLSATRAFCGHWLLPRLANFQRLHPEIDLRLQATDEPVSLAADEADLAIRYASGPFPGLLAQVLLADRFAPVAHPSLGLRTAMDLAATRLIHYDWTRASAEQPTWARWFDLAKREAPSMAGSLHFSDESHAIQAVLGGQGVALLSLCLVANELALGSLVTPFGPSLEGRAYHLLQAAERRQTPAIAAVRDWLLVECGAVTVSG